jgi:hypothetical protein
MNRKNEVGGLSPKGRRRLSDPICPAGYVDEPIEESTYLAMLKVGWCYRSTNGVVLMTPLGLRELMAACADGPDHVREEWLAPD